MEDEGITAEELEKWKQLGMMDTGGRGAPIGDLIDAANALPRLIREVERLTEEVCLLRLAGDTFNNGAPMEVLDPMLGEMPLLRGLE